MKLMKSMLVGIIGLSMMIAQPGQGSQEPPPEARVFQEAMQQSGGNLEAAYNAVYDFAKKNAMNEQDWNPELFEECAGVAKDALMSTAQDGGSPQDAFRDAMEAAGKCSGEIPPHDPMLMDKVRKYKERNWAPEEGSDEWMKAWDDFENWKDWKPRFAPDHEGQMDHNTGGQMDHEGQMDHNTGGQMDHDGKGDHEGQMDPVAKAFFSVMDSGGDFDEAFKAGESVARGMDQREGDYDEEQWNKCRDRAYRAGRKAADEGADPGQVFDAVGRAGNECRDGGPRGGDQMDHEGQMDHDGKGDHDGEPTELDRMFEGLEEMLRGSGINEGDAKYMFELAESLEKAAHSENESDANSGAAGEAMQAAEKFVKEQQVPEQVARGYMRMLCMIEWATHKERGAEGAPDCDR